MISFVLRQGRDATHLQEAIMSTSLKSNSAKKLGRIGSKDDRNVGGHCIV